MPSRFLTLPTSPPIVLVEIWPYVASTSVHIRSNGPNAPIADRSIKVLGAPEHLGHGRDAGGAASMSWVKENASSW